jgi:hypothetical protein
MPTEDDLRLRPGPPHAGDAPGAPAPAAHAAEEAAWAEVVSRWGDDEAHRGYLARFADLDGLARAGGRYRDALAARPGDAVAARWRDEVVKRATVQGLASLPRTRPPEQEFRRVRRARAGVAALAVG